MPTKPIGMKMKILRKNKIEMLQFPVLGACCDIFHFCTTRAGGVSEGPFASLNPAIYTDDDPAAIRENLHRLAEAAGVPADRIIVPHQIHGERIGTIDETFLQKKTEEQTALLEGIDALMTDCPGICLAVATADCVPLLLYAPDKKVVAAVHAGWRGTVKRIAQKTVQALCRVYGCEPTQLHAGIGPSIGPAAFEVGEEVVEAFRASGLPVGQLVSRHPENGKAHINLWEANRLQLMEAGVVATNIETAACCTYTHSKELFSARKLGIRSGRILSGIYLRLGK